MSDAEFLSKRLARVAKLAGVSMPDMPHEKIAEVAGTILGEIARKLAAQSEPAQAVTLTDAEIHDCIDGIDFSQMVTADDLFYLIARAIERRLLSGSAKTGEAE